MPNWDTTGNPVFDFNQYYTRSKNYNYQFALILLEDSL